MRFFFHTGKLFFKGSINSFTPTPSYGGNIYHCNFYTCGQNPMMSPFKWNLFGKTCVWCYLILRMLQFSNVVIFFFNLPPSGVKVFHYETMPSMYNKAKRQHYFTKLLQHCLPLDVCGQSGFRISNLHLIILAPIMHIFALTWKDWIKVKAYKAQCCGRSKTATLETMKEKG